MQTGNTGFAALQIAKKGRPPPKRGAGTAVFPFLDKNIDRFVDGQYGGPLMCRIMMQFLAIIIPYRLFFVKEKILSAGGANRAGSALFYSILNFFRTDINTVPRVSKGGLSAKSVDRKLKLLVYKRKCLESFQKSAKKLCFFL